MHPFSRSLLWLFVSSLACGAPAELDESIFPSPNATGYADATGAFGGSSAAGGGGSPLAQGGRSGGVGGSGNASQGGSMPLGMGGAGVSLGGGASSMGGSASGGGTGGSAPTGGNAGSGTMPQGCPDDVTELFRRPGNQGGCEGSACHIPGVVAPDLVSPNVLDRLLNEPSACMGRPYIGPDDSFLAEKISASGPDCGGAMPFLTPQALSAADEQCILDWIDEVASGG